MTFGFSLKANVKLCLACIVIILNSSCESKSKEVSLIKEDALSEDYITNASFGTILNTALLEGSILIYDPEKKEYYSNDFNWARARRLPASTYKIPHTIIGLESGSVSDSTIFKWNGEKRAFAFWEQDHILEEAYRRSCLPCYQELAMKIGVDTMTYYLEKIDYPGMVVDTNNLNRFWIYGSSAINQMEQIDFLQRLFTRQLPIKKSTQDYLERIVLEKDSSSYKIWSKTGWNFDEDGNNNGWYVGRLRKAKKEFYFATNIEPQSDFDMKAFSKIRKEVTVSAFRSLSIID